MPQNIWGCKELRFGGGGQLKVILVLGLLIIMVSLAAATVVSSKHDMRPLVHVGDSNAIYAVGATTSQVCVFCHLICTAARPVSWGRNCCGTLIPRR